ncbi:MAG: glycosyltransferase family 4 protein [Candidatus Aquicultor sp.]
MQPDKLKIAYVTSTDANDKRAWSGTHYSIFKALQKYCGDVYHVGPLKSYTELFLKASSKVFQIATLNQKKYDYFHSPLLSKTCARMISSRLSGRQFDLIFAPAGSTEIAHLDIDIPIIYLSDTTFSLLVDYYPAYTNLLKRSVRSGNQTEALALQKASLVLYSSEWAAASAVNDYVADRSKIHVIPFGANIENAPPADFVVSKRLEEKNPAGTCKLLFLNVDWHRKGGEIAFDTLVELDNMGIDAELIICGCVPPNGFSHKGLSVMPFLNKNKQDDLEKLRQLFWDADFLLLPTRQDCTPMVFCEANAFGLPVITTDTGGISSAIRSGVNGFALPIHAGGYDYAELIQRIYYDRPRYAELVQNSRIEFDQRLNWDSWGMAVNIAINDLLSTSATFNPRCAC